MNMKTNGMINNGKYTVNTHNPHIIPDKEWLEKPRNQWDDIKYFLKK